MSDKFGHREKAPVAARNRDPLHAAIASTHLYYLRQDDDFAQMDEDRQNRRIRAELRGLYLFLESGINEGEEVALEHRTRRQDIQLEGPLVIVKASGDHPLALKVEGQRVRFRGLNWIERI